MLRTLRPATQCGFTVLEIIGIIAIILLAIGGGCLAIGELTQLAAANVSSVTISGPGSLLQGASGTVAGKIVLESAAAHRSDVIVQIWEDDDLSGDELLAQQKITIPEGSTEVSFNVSLRCRVSPTPQLLIGPNGADREEGENTWEVYFYLSEWDKTVIDADGERESSNVSITCVLTPEELPGEEEENSESDDD